MNGSLPDDATARNGMPIADGVLYYFPNALAEIAKVSKAGNDQHNPGEPMHWSRGKSTDHANKIIRHLIDAGKRDGKGMRHSAYMAWRALALLQEEIERDEGAPLPRNARFDTKEVNDGQVPTNPVPAGNRQESVQPMAGRSGAERDVGGDGGSVHPTCRYSESDLRLPRC